MYFATWFETIAERLRRRSPRRIRTRLLLYIIPSVITIMCATGYLTSRVSTSFLNQALARSARTQVLALAHDLNTQLAACRQDLLLLADQPVDQRGLERFARTRKTIRHLSLCELAFISQKDRNHLYFIIHDDQTVQVPHSLLGDISPSPYLLFERISGTGPGQVLVEPVCEVMLPFPSEAAPNRTISIPVIRFLTPVHDPAGNRLGFLLLSLDARQLRNTLSLYNSPGSPLFAFERSPELRYFYLFDKNGWVLFQSDTDDSPGEDLTTFLPRQSYTGTMGRPDLPGAFRPDRAHREYWDMVNATAAGLSWVNELEDTANVSGRLDTFFLTSAPISFTSPSSAEPEIFGGAAFVDRSRITLQAGYRHVDAVFLISLVTICLVSLLICGLSLRITRPILSLAKAIEAAGENLEPVTLSEQDYETSQVTLAVNAMLATIREQMDTIRNREETIARSSMEERVCLKTEAEKFFQTPAAGEEADLTTFVGTGPLIQGLKSEILKAANVDVDVLITGETGTGKELTARAIHSCSSRKDKPFISINCGALDENLLLDALFGHKKGAFTQAGTDRKGAFQEAHQGTLFLDEAATASPKVQQALLRTLAIRSIKPLGSDREIDIDVRVIAATNEDLKQLIRDNLFREDLYYRLKVISITTPPLRDHKSSLPILTAHFLTHAEAEVKRSGMGLSRGALQKMLSYDWPGNVRELKNCLTRAVVMAESDIIRTRDIQLEQEEDFPSRHPESDSPPSPGIPVDSSGSIPVLRETSRLTPRQRRVLPMLLERKKFTKKEYHDALGGNVSARTALYDLQDLIKKGILQKTGKGPATRYHLPVDRSPFTENNESGP